MATGGGVGYFPVAPGTAGTVVAIPVYLAISLFPPLIAFLTVLALTALACYVSQEGQTIFGQPDPPSIVIDEIVGFLWAMWLIAPTIEHIVTSFLLFRFYDILKPFPIRFLERRLPGGVGIVADDVVAAAYSRLTFELIRSFLF
ncbi:MAG: phosphatidylglycerophosphatase A [Syntrophales bacterium]|nr:phosphatidylglycerophosphatase A [Syntrophales bacterium]